MSNRARNWEAVHVNRALITGQAASIAEAVANWFVQTVFGVDLSRPMQKGAMWARNERR